MEIGREVLVAAARAARLHAYAPYSQFRVGAALLFENGTIVAGSNVENASYGLSLCAETVAAAKALSEGGRSPLLAVAVAGGARPTAPCGRCRQVLHELASLGPTDPLVLCAGEGESREMRLSQLLPDAFGPADLS